LFLFKGVLKETSVVIGVGIGVNSVFHQFRQTTFANDGLILSSSQFLQLAPVASRNGARFKSGQN
jgi:hypothetical protein